MFELHGIWVLDFLDKLCSFCVDHSHQYGICLIRIMGILPWSRKSWRLPLQFPAWQSLSMEMSYNTSFDHPLVLTYWDRMAQRSVLKQHRLYQRSWLPTFVFQQTQLYILYIYIHIESKRQEQAIIPLNGFNASYVWGPQRKSPRYWNQLKSSKRFQHYPKVLAI